MGLLLRFPQPTATPLVRTAPWLLHASKTKRSRIFKAKPDNDDDGPFFQAAMERASLRHRETLRPDPLFTDPYIQCLLPPDNQRDANQNSHKHCLATKFIDDKLLTTIEKTDGLRQIVLLTDGMDTRPYRLKWPSSTIIYNVSPDRIFKQSFEKLQDVGAKIPRSCLFLHVPAGISSLQQALSSKGFNGTRPSVWVFQGLPITTLANFKDMLDVFSCLAMKGCFLFGELPNWLVETEVGTKSTILEWMDKIFMIHGLRVEIVDYDEVARDLGRESDAADDLNNILFSAKQLQYSDDQVEMWRNEFLRIEEQGDEEGFEEL